MPNVPISTLVMNSELGASLVYTLGCNACRRAPVVFSQLPLFPYVASPNCVTTCPISNDYANG
jgi:hypothetical protein